MSGVKGLIAKGPPSEPQWLLFLRIGTIVLSLAVFIAACFNVSLLSRWLAGYSGPGGMAIFTVIWHWIVVGLDIGFGMKFKHLYFRIMFLVLYVLDIIFWLSAWSYAASLAGWALGYGFGSNSTYDKYGGSLAAIAALGAFNWVAIIVLFVFWLLASIKSPEANPASNAELGSVKQDTGASQPFVAQPSYGAPQDPQYGQPQQYGQTGYPQQQPQQPYGAQPTYGQ